MIVKFFGTLFLFAFITFTFALAASIPENILGILWLAAVASIFGLILGIMAEGLKNSYKGNKPEKLKRKPKEEYFE